MSELPSVAEALHKYERSREQYLRAQILGHDAVIDGWRRQVEVDSAEVDAAVDRRIRSYVRDVEIIG